MAVALICPVFVPDVIAEGVASMTEVTAENRDALLHHTLKVSLKSQRGRTGVSLFIKPEEETPLTSCSVTIYSGTDKKVLGRFDISVHSRPLFFEVADELVDNVKIRYSLHANEGQSHIYTINAGELRKLAGT